MIIQSAHGVFFFNLIVVRQGNVSNLNIFVAPLVEELDAADFVGNFFWKDRIGGTGVFDLNLSVIRHFGVRFVSGVYEEQASRLSGSLLCGQGGSSQVVVLAPHPLAPYLG